MTAPILHRTASAFTLAMALSAAPALAQDAPAAAPPLVIQPAPAPVPQAAMPAPVPQVVAPPPVVATPEPVAEESATPVARTQRSTATRAVTRSVTRTAPVAAIPAPIPVTAPVDTAPAPVAPEAVAVAPVEEVAPAPAVPVAADTTTTETTKTSGTPIWPFAALAALIVALGAFFVIRNRRRDEEVEYYEETVVAPVYVEPVAGDEIVVAPAMAAHAYDAPVEEHADLATADAEEVAALAATDAPAGRPWIELSFRPVRAGATDKSATVDVELTLGNAGDVAAEDVRVSTFMLGDQSDAPTAMEGLLATRHTSTEVDAGDIEPGEGSRVDATLSVPRDTMSGGTFSPVVVADVRYRLPNGQEGRTAASFVVGGANEDETLTPLRLGGDMRDDVSAALHGELERA